VNVTASRSSTISTAPRFEQLRIDRLRRLCDDGSTRQMSFSPLFRSFFRHTEEGRFQFEDSEKLWSLICAITLTKVREKVRNHRRDKRDVYRETDPPQNHVPHKKKARTKRCGLR